MSLEEDIDSWKKKRSIFRRNTTKLVNKILDLRNSEEKIDRIALKSNSIQLTKQYEELRILDKNILEFSLKNEENDVCEKELEDTSEYENKVTQALIFAEEKLGEDDEVCSVISCGSNKSMSKESIASNTSESQDWGNPSTVRVKLPKLELRKFSGDIHEFQEFWDSFSSAIHENTGLANVDKLKYLKGFLEGQARSVISGLPVTDANYEVAINLIKKRFAKPSVIQHAHINRLISISPVYNEDDVNRLRKFRDEIEANFRGLEAQGVEKSSYSRIVVPVLVEKLPKSIKYNMVRSCRVSVLDWELDELIRELDLELEVRETNSELMKFGDGNRRDAERRRPSSEYKEFRKMNTANALFAAEAQGCIFCKAGHKAEDCNVHKSPEDRKNILRKVFRCFVCLKQGHRSFECRSKAKCFQCKARHHVSLCDCAKPPREEHRDAHDKEALRKSNASAPSWVGSTCSGDSVALQTALGSVNDKREGKVRVLFDSGSHRSFITAKAVKALGLRPVRRETLVINAFGCRESEEKERDVVEFTLMPVKGGKNVKIACIVVNSIASISNIHVEKVKKSYEHLQMIWFSDVSRSDDKLAIQVLIGADFQWQFLEGEQIRGGPHDPVAVKTTLGWVLSGPLQGEKLNSSSFCAVNFLQCEKSKSLDEQVNKLWDLDSLGIRPNDDVHEFLVDNIKFTGERYSVSLPWKAGLGPLPLNYTNCVARLKSQVKKLKQDPEVFQKYNDVIIEQLNSGIVSRVSELEETGKVSYLPHSAVIREAAETTKVRVVYDASCKDKNTRTSLNDCLHVGPSLTPLIFDILLRFRQLKVALVGDIAKAFLNIEVNESDRNCLRFLWLKDIDAKEPEIMVLRFNRVVFGVSSSPFLFNAVLRYHLSSFEDVDPEFVEIMCKSFYVDDLVLSSGNITEAYSLYCKARERMLDGGFSLRKWKTSDCELRQLIMEKEKDESTLVVEAQKDEESFAKETLGPAQEAGGKTKVLGIIWDSSKDILEFDLMKMATNIKASRPTKRGVLSTLAMSFDPLGLISPIGVHAKVLFQDLCVGKLDWDEPIPRDKVAKWEDWITGLSQVKTITVTRCIQDQNGGEILSYQLHGFADASKKAYCATVYLVCITTKGIFSKLLCSKVRVAPLKELSIPRLELLSARILANLISNVQKALHPQINIDKTRCWLDSKTALFWIFNQGEWKQWVQFRVAEILKLTEKTSWGHVGGKENPADIGSRGATALFLVNSKLWWEGPEWLRKGEREWPTSLLVGEPKEVAEERRKACVLSVTTEKRARVSNAIDINGRFNSLCRLLNVTAWVIRFIFNLKQRREGKERNTERLQVEEVIEAEKLWIQDAQITLRGEVGYEKIRDSLGIIEKKGILVCQGRLQHSDLHEDSKYPIILPKEHKLAQLVVLECHKRVHHMKVRATLAELRSRFWITRGRQFVKKIIKPCYYCRLQDGKPFNAPATSALPEFRVAEAPPFSTTGMDFAGPLYVKGKGDEMSKMYIALFSCFITRAIHLELVTDLTSATFINCLRRFCARRGTPVRIVSDNAKMFKATCSFLNKAWREAEVGEFFISKRVIWKFNLDRTPWWGGAFERMVGIVKRCLRKVLGNARLNQDEMSTVLVEVECTVNSRPLTYSYEELEAQVLTPSHLLLGRRLSPLSDYISCELDIVEGSNYDNLSKRFLYLMKKLSHFWKRWHNEYLLGLREVHKLQQNKGNAIKEGDIVLLQDENNPKRNTWKMAIVEELIKGADNVIRGAKVRKAACKGKTKILSRPLQKFFPLEIQSESTAVERMNGEKSTSEMTKTNEDVREPRPRRAAALDAQWKSQSMLDP